MKKLNFGNINAGLDTLTELMEQNAGIARDMLIDANLIDFAEKNTYAASDTDESIQELADQIDAVGLLNPLGVIEHGNRYTLFSGERRYRAITRHLRWDKIPCRVFDSVSDDKAQLMLHIANAERDLSAGQKLTLFEEYHELLSRMKESGQLSSSLQKNLAKLLNVSERQVRKYKVISEQLSVDEKELLAKGELTVTDASQIATARTKAGLSSSFEESDVQEKTETIYSVDEPADSNPEEKGTEEEAELSSAFDESAADKTSEAETEKPIEYQIDRKELLKKAILEEHLWDNVKLYDFYVRTMPTPQEAIKQCLKKTYSYGSGVHCCHTLTTSRITLQPHVSAQMEVYTYTEADTVIRELYRDKLLCPERQK